LTTTTFDNCAITAIEPAMKAGGRGHIFGYIYVCI
jgi:hypothetical protein